MPRKAKIDEPKKKIEKKSGYLYAVGRRKTAIAKVRLYKNGKGDILVNDKPIKEYFNAGLREIINAPLQAIGQLDKIDIIIKVIGGGISGQAEAVRHGISRALVDLNLNFRKPLKKAGYLKRDARAKERKKPGLKRARRAPQWSKR
ncbi:30S ribosomal protein S9 [Candidatus Falkowbacteria bacterium]|nr:30S ribosomal protein S9 [Candidatus Falkowbacteria bacterium]